MCAKLGQQGSRDAQLAIVLTMHAGVDNCPGAVCAILRTSEVAASLPSIGKPTQHPRSGVELDIRSSYCAGPQAAHKTKPGCQAEADSGRTRRSKLNVGVRNTVNSTVAMFQCRQPRWQQELMVQEEASVPFRSFCSKAQAEESENCGRADEYLAMPCHGG